MQDKIEGKTDQAKGKVEEEAGKMTGDKSDQVQGKWDIPADRSCRNLQNDCVNLVNIRNVHFDIQTAHI